MVETQSEHRIRALEAAVASLDAYREYYREPIKQLVEDQTRSTVLRAEQTRRHGQARSLVVTVSTVAAATVSVVGGLVLVVRNLLGLSVNFAWFW